MDDQVTNKRKNTLSMNQLKYYMSISQLEIKIKICK